ncbi:MAG: glycosyltransferase family 2 protein [Microcystis aeruginosa Ma_AC_P_19900807_S299]|uniref:Glycosyltransferase family 2 protein n=1 Tax=Microcystis aeruginosa Ma_SC_T_19800800_S464 TaxID=2486257 RepID=A0A552E3M9_MICAE|nr:MAG: glycosyltransferase family 2 protein [Microcystis aeruginosa Ma_AC_P_19900807_S299]TRU29044.1 MAG: glycosyltransferase family 2 protein [Microcystis aeruginosa Ma_SC_T_19800800_S464]
MADFQLTTPVAFLIFNRPDTTARVFEAIRQAKPPKLLVVADGPRADRPDDVEKCKAARAIIDGVDWDCEVLTNYSDVNLGCKNRVSGGLDWVFNTVEEAIILEDDCLPHPTFFRFCEELLQRYQGDTRIMSICGVNFQFGRKTSKYSYYYSIYHDCWGWATWKRAWKNCDVNMNLWEILRDTSFLKDKLLDSGAAKYWQRIFQAAYEDKINSWFYPWLFSCWDQSGFGIFPQENLVSNIGFGESSTHTKNSSDTYANLPLVSVDFPLNHPPFILQNKQADKFTQNTRFYPPLIQRVIRKIKSRMIF